mmetsp:Transcript_54628/g.127379  ORF Transcript_54628/g.127379 Transcript_54628/m.127379 type:complete len:208 (+) Transcript_54628:706-1329(+)
MLCCPKRRPHADGCSDIPARRPQRFRPEDEQQDRLSAVALGTGHQRVLWKQRRHVLFACRAGGCWRRLSSTLHGRLRWQCEGRPHPLPVQQPWHLQCLRHECNPSCGLRGLGSLCAAASPSRHPGHVDGITACGGSVNTRFHSACVALASRPVRRQRGMGYAFPEDGTDHYFAEHPLQARKKDSNDPAVSSPSQEHSVHVGSGDWAV